MMAVMSLFLAHQESRLKSDRLSAAWKNKKAQARSSNKLATSRLPQWLRVSASGMKIEIVVERADLIRKMFEFSRDGWGCYSICRFLNEQEVPTWTLGSDVWKESYVKKILSNRAVLGEYQPYQRVQRDGRSVRIPDGNPISQYFPAIIDEQLFDQAASARRKRLTNGRGRTGRGYANLFSGLLKCSLCGSAIRFMNKGTPPKGGMYLRCSNALVHGMCVAPYWRYKLVEDVILASLQEIDFSSAIGEEGRSTASSRLQRAISDADEELSKIGSQIEKLISLVTHTDSSVPELAERLNLLESRRATLNQERQAALTEKEALSARSLIKHRERLLEILPLIDVQGLHNEREEIRRNLAAQMRRLLRQIGLRPIRHVPYEIEIDKPAWYLREAPDQQTLEKLCAIYSFEITLEYLSGDVSIIDPLSDAAMRMISNKQMRIFLADQSLPR